VSKNKSSAWTHDDLLHDLANCCVVEKSCIVFTEVGIGSRSLQGGSVPVPDVLTLQKSYTRPTPTIYDIKVSRSDFLQDVRKDKWQRYLPYCQRFYFACPTGLVKKNEVPVDAGLITRSENGWHTTKTPRVQSAPDYTMWDVQALLMAGVYTMQGMRQLQNRFDAEESIDLRDHTFRVGKKLAGIARQYEKLQDQHEDLREKLAIGGGGAHKHVVTAVSRITGKSLAELAEMKSGDVQRMLVYNPHLTRVLKLMKDAMMIASRAFPYGGQVARDAERLDALEIQLEEEKHHDARGSQGAPETAVPG
jgi:hypothetical protein